MIIEIRTAKNRQGEVKRLWLNITPEREVTVYDDTFPLIEAAHFEGMPKTFPLQVTQREFKQWADLLILREARNAQR